MLNTEILLNLITIGLTLLFPMQYTAIITMNSRHGTSGGYILKLSVNLPWSNRRKAL